MSRPPLTIQLSREATRAPDVAPGSLARAYAVWILLISATIPWRKNTYFDGGLDSVVILKAILSFFAMLIAAHGAVGHRPRPVPAAPIVLLASYLLVTVIGGVASGAVMAATVVAVRVAVLAVTISLLFARYAAEQVMGSLVRILGIVATVATLTGLNTAASGRLQGALPPLNPNELAFMASVCFFWLFARMLRAEESTLDFFLAILSVGVVVLTGSRSSLAGLFVGIVVMALRITALTRRSFGAVMLLAPILGFVALGTDILSSVLLRGGERGITTLSNRTIAWDAALTSDRGPWETWFGAGLAQKKISVPGQWWNTQLLDSSWISALVQGGLLGLLLVTVIIFGTILRAAAFPKATGSLWLGLVVYLASRAMLESGLFDSTTAFMVLMVTMLACRVPPDPNGSADRAPEPWTEANSGALARHRPHSLLGDPQDAPSESLR